MTIRIVGNQIPLFDWGLNFGHLQLVRGSDTLATEIEVQPSDQFTGLGVWDVIVGGDHHETFYSPIERGRSVGHPYDPDRYQEVVLNLHVGQTESSVWSTASQYATLLSGMDFQYSPSQQNSNSFMNTLLYMVGHDVEIYLTQLSAGQISRYPAVSRNVLFDVVPIDFGTDVSVATSGTSSADYIRLGRGNDTITSSGGEDRIYTASGDDTLTAVLDAAPAGQYGIFEADQLRNIYDLGRASSWFGSDHDVVTYANVDEWGSTATAAFGVQDGEIVAAISSYSKGTDLVLGADEFLNIGEIDLSALDGGSTYTHSSGTLDVTGASSVQLDRAELDRLIGTRGRDVVTIDQAGANGSPYPSPDVYGGEGDDFISVSAAGVYRIDGGSGSDVLRGNVRVREIWGGNDDDQLYSAGDSYLNGGHGADQVFATFEDFVVGDADDTLYLNGVEVTGDIMFNTEWSFGDPTWDGGASTLSQALENLDVAVFVRPTPRLRDDFDGTVSTIEWYGWLVEDPSYAEHIDPFTNEFDTDTADAAITFRIGDFGINAGGIGHLDYIYDAYPLFLSSWWGPVPTDRLPAPPPGALPTIDAANLPTGSVSGTPSERQSSPAYEHDEDFYAYTRTDAADVQAFWEFARVEEVTSRNFTMATIEASAGIPLAGTLEAETLQGTAASDELRGEGGADNLIGDAGADLLYGGDGDDYISGGAQYDVIHGGDGDDRVDGGDGRDTVYLGAGNDVFLDNDQTGTHAHDAVWGGDGADRILGGGGDDAFHGEAGADEITGGIGDDVLSGGAGADVFLFASGDGADLVTDFALGEDLLVIDGAGIDPGDLPSDVTAAQDGTDVVLSYGAGDTIRLAGQDVADWGGSGGGGPAVIGEAGTVTVSQSGGGAWHRVTFAAPLADAVVVMGPVSFAGSQAATTRVRAVSETGFEFQIDEWDYLDGGHIAETIGWLAVEAGTHTLASGQAIVAGTQEIGTGFETVSFGTTLADAIVLSEVVTANEASAVTTRTKGVTSTGVELRLQEEEGADGVHADETVAWIAIEAGTDAGTGSVLQAFRTPDSLTHTAQEFLFASPFDAAPVLLADLQTTDGGDTAVLRAKALTATGATLFVEEEKSKDTEIGHTTEVAGILGIEDGWLMSA